MTAFTNTALNLTGANLLTNAVHNVGGTVVNRAVDIAKQFTGKVCDYCTFGNDVAKADSPLNNPFAA